MSKNLSARELKILGDIYRSLKSNFTSKSVLKKYELKNIREKYRILELLYEPNGYTIIGFTKEGYEKLTNERIKRNFIKID